MYKYTSDITGWSATTASLAIDENFGMKKYSVIQSDEYIYDKDEQEERMVWLATSKKSSEQHTKRKNNHKFY